MISKVEAPVSPTNTPTKNDQEAGGPSTLGSVNNLLTLLSLKSATSLLLSPFLQLLSSLNYCLNKLSLHHF